MKHDKELYKNEILQQIATSSHPGYVKRRLIMLFNQNMYAFSWSFINNVAKEIIYNEETFNNLYILISNYKDTKITNDLIKILKKQEYFDLFIKILETDKDIVADLLLIQVIEKGQKCVKTFLNNKIYEKSEEAWTIFLNTWKPDTLYDISNMSNCLAADEKFQEIMNKKISEEPSSDFKNHLFLLNLCDPENEETFNNFKIIISEIDEIDPSKFNSNLWDVIFDDIKFRNYLKFSNKPHPLDSELLEILSVDSKSTTYLERIKLLMEKFLKNIHVDETSNQISWCEDLITFHKIVPIVLQYKENHYVSIKWLIKNAPKLLNNEKILEPDILLDLKLLNNINKYCELHEKEVSINIDLLRKYEASALKELRDDSFDETSLAAVPEEFLIDKNITRNYLKLNRMRIREDVGAMTDGNATYLLVNPSFVNKNDDYRKAYFLVSNIKLVKLIAMSNNLTSLVINKYNEGMGKRNVKGLIGFNYEILNIINSSAYQKLCASRLGLIMNDDVAISLEQDKVVQKTFGIK